MLEHDAQPLLGDREPGGHRPLGNAERLRDGAVGVAVVVPQHDRSRLLRRQLGQRRSEVAVLHDLLRVGSQAGAAQAADDLADLAQPHLALVRDRRVDRDAVHPRLSGCYRLPGSPLFVSAFECVLRAVLGRGSVAEHRGQGAQNLSVRSLIETLEVRFVAGFIRVRRFTRLAGCPCGDWLCHLQSFTPMTR